MSIKITLKKRSIEGAVTLPLTMVRAYVALGEAEGGRRLWAEMSRAADVPQFIHDKQWLELIVNFVPDGKQPLTAIAPWLRIANRVSELDAEKEGSFTLSDFEVKLIWSRLTSAKFVLERVTAQFAAFILELQDAFGMTFEGQEQQSEKGGDA